MQGNDMHGDDMIFDEESNDSKVEITINEKAGTVSPEVQDVFDKVTEFFSGNNPPLELLRIACLGNAEKTIQGELFHYLRKNGFNAVIECGYRYLSPPTKVPDRHIDIVVFKSDSSLVPNGSGFNGAWLPIVAIELKHYSPNQSRTILPLLVGLENDYNKRIPSLPLIQVGLYTEIYEIQPCPVIQSQFPLLQYYRFLTAKSYKILSSCGNWNITKMNTIFSGKIGGQVGDKDTANKWANSVTNSPTNLPRYSRFTNLVRGHPESFDVDPSSGLKIKGRVNWLAMLAP